jgi:putative DNA primase/helicase
VSKYKGVAADPDLSKEFKSDAIVDQSLDTGEKSILANLNNAVTIIEQDPTFCDVWFDEFLQRKLTGSPPREWTDADDISLTLRFQREKGIRKMSRETVTQAVTEIAFRNKKNCVRDWIEFLVWDGEPRIEHFFEDHYGAPASDYTRCASRNFWISMVARVHRPGCQVDNMIVLEGPQGIRKSSSMRVIGGSYYAEQNENVAHKDFFQNLQGKLLIEISEMDSFSRSEVARVKQVITTTSDRYRESYGRNAADHPRQCIFVGTTNRDDWNRDETGARRFWPIVCSDIDLDGIAANRDQLFAEAVFRFKSGETWWEMPADETRNQQDSRYVAPAWADPITRYIENERFRIGEHWEWTRRAENLTELAVAEVLEHALEIPRGQWNKASEMRVAEALRHLGWMKKDVKRNGKTVKRWMALPPEGSNLGIDGNS